MDYMRNTQHKLPHSERLRIMFLHTLFFPHEYVVLKGSKIIVPLMVLQKFRLQ